MLGACLVFFVLSEGTARFVLSFDSVLDRVRVEDDSWLRLDWIRRHRSGIEIYYGFDVFDPLLGWRARANVRDMRVFGDRILNTNSRGLRGAGEHAYARQPGSRRILVLGDSFTFGDEVSDSETYCAYLQGMLPEAEIINLGVHGFGHDQMLLLLRSEGTKYQPDVVVLGFVYVDIQRNLLAFNDYAKPRFVPSGADLTLTNVPVPAPPVTVANEPWRPKSLDVLHMLDDALRPDVGDRRARALGVRVLDEIVATVRQAGAQLVFFYLPIEQECNSAAAVTGTEEFMVRYCESRNVHWATARDRFLERVRAGHMFKARPGGHWSPDGHRAVAEGLSHKLRGLGLVQ